MSDKAIKPPPVVEPPPVAVATDIIEDEEDVTAAAEGAEPVPEADLDSQVAAINLITSRDERISQLRSLFNTYSREGDAQLGGYDLLTATSAIDRGKILSALHEIVSVKAKWGPWFVENFPALKIRTATNWTRLARRSDCHRHAILGEARLLKLVSLTNGHEGPDPITEFFTRMGLAYDAAAGSLSLETKAEIDAAIELAQDARPKKSLRDFRSWAAKLAAKTAPLAGDEEAVKELETDIADLVTELTILLEKAAATTASPLSPEA
jgi:hypothetical protein